MMKIKQEVFLHKMADWLLNGNIENMELKNMTYEEAQAHLLAICDIREIDKDGCEI